MATWVRSTGWQINDGPEHIYLRNGNETLFGLQDESVPGTMRYGVTYDKDQMYAGWSDQRFIELGQAMTPWNSEILPAWNGSLKCDPLGNQKEQYDKAIQNWLATTSTNTARLEGEISIPDKFGTRVEAITMMLAERAAYDQKGNVIDLLIIVSRLGFDWSRGGGYTAAQDGTAHAKQR